MKSVLKILALCLATLILNGCLVACDQPNHKKIEDAEEEQLLYYVPPTVVASEDEADDDNVIENGLNMEHGHWVNLDVDY